MVITAIPVDSCPEAGTGTRRAGPADDREGRGDVSGPEACTAMAVRRLARRVTRLYDDALAPHGLTIGQLGLLYALRRSRGISVNALADRLDSDASTLSRLLRPLEAAGLLTVVVAPADRRQRLVLLTDAGFERRGRATPAWRAVQAEIANRLGDGRLAALRFLLDDARRHLDSPASGALP